MIWYEFIKFFFEQQYNFHLCVLKTYYYIMPYSKKMEALTLLYIGIYIRNRQGSYLS